VIFQAAEETESMNLEHSLCMLREVVQASGARARIFVKGKPAALKPEVKEQIYLMGKQALLNAVRHSEASQIEAEVEYRPGRLRVVIRDNGRGIDPRSVQSGKLAHWGLERMRERAERIGAQLRIWSRPGAGTEVEISIAGQIAAAAFA
jgi:signal transduction histidine kinase